MTRLFYTTDKDGCLDAPIYDPNFNVEDSWVNGDVLVNTHQYTIGTTAALRVLTAQEFIYISLRVPMDDIVVRVLRGSNRLWERVMKGGQRFEMRFFSDQDVGQTLTVTLTSLSALTLPPYPVRVLSLNRDQDDIQRFRVNAALSGGSGALKVEIQNPGTGITP